MLTCSDRDPYFKELPCVAVDTAPAMVWSMYQGKAGSVHPSGPFVVLHRQERAFKLCRAP